MNRRFASACNRESGRGPHFRALRDASGARNSARLWSAPVTWRFLLQRLGIERSLELELLPTQLSVEQRSALRKKAGFTLIELILVMTILTIAISITAPALSNFFRGR